MWIVLLRTKDEAAASLRRFAATTELESGQKMRTLRTDRGGEFTSKEFMEFCADRGTTRHLTAPYSPRQNGVVERRNQTVVGMARSMLKGMGMPAAFWGEAVTTVVFVLNRSFTRSVEGRTPHEAWYGRKPDVQFLRVFGCRAHVKITRPNLTKLEDRSTPAVFLGYEPGSKAYRLYDPVSKRVLVSRDVVFEEAQPWNWSNGGEASTVEFTVEYPDYGGAVQAPAAAEGEGPQQPAVSTAAEENSPGLHVAAEEQGEESATPEPAAEEAVELAMPPMVLDPELFDDDDDVEVLHRYRRVSNLLGPDATAPGLAESLFLTSAEEPATVGEAEKEPSWRKAMLEEMTSIEENFTWELVDLPQGHKPIGLKWVFKTKRNEHGDVVKHKARIVAKGYVQRHGVDYEEVFAPVARIESVRLLFALAAQERWEVHHMDVKSAFLNGELQEEVYVAQPPGFVITGKESKVLRLRKALYGLRQAPRAWNAKLDATMLSLGFQRSRSEHDVYARQKLIVGVYVDDLVITGSCGAEIGQFKAEMKNSFRMSDLGLLRYYLGIEVRQNASGITLVQTAYAKSVLERAGMEDCNPCQFPMEARLKLSKDSTAPPVDVTKFRSIVGSLRYLVHTRQDIAYAVGYVSRFMERPTEEHWVAVKHILRYIAGTLDYGCSYGRKAGGCNLLGFSDSDMAGDVDTRKSTTGVLFFLSNSPVSWQSQKQKVVALSSCEAEYIAATTGACQGTWLARLLGDLTGGQPKAATLMVDNKSAISLIKNPVFHDKSKHIDLRYHWIRECVEKKQIFVEFIRTEAQLADILTKPLGRVKFQEMREKISVVKINSACQGLGGVLLA
jgi:hypothetical protein